MLTASIACTAIRSWQRLSPGMKKRLTVENDDRASMFSVSDLLWLHEKVGIPIVFDFHVRPSAPLALSSNGYQTLHTKLQTLCQGMGSASGVPSQVLVVIMPCTSVWLLHHVAVL